MTPTLDQSLTAVVAAEATLLADQASEASIKASIATATAPLAPATAKVASDVLAFNAAIDAAITALQDAKLTVLPIAA